MRIKENTLIIIYICNKHLEPVIILPARKEEEDPELPEEGWDPPWAAGGGCPTATAAICIAAAADCCRCKATAAWAAACAWFTCNACKTSEVKHLKLRD